MPKFKLNRPALIRGGVLLASFALPVLARAAVGDDPFADAVADGTTKVGTYGAALVALAAVGTGFGIAIKYVKKIRGAA